MDLALAHTVAQGLAAQATKLGACQMLMAWHRCRVAKETLFSDPKLTSAPVTVLGRGSKVIGGTIKAELSRGEVDKALLEGFFPECSPDAEPKPQRTVGLQELGLPYASDPAMTKHLAHFLHPHTAALAHRRPPRRKKKPSTRPTAILFNGGVFKAKALRERVADVLSRWSSSIKEPATRVLDGGH